METWFRLSPTVRVVLSQALGFGFVLLSLLAEDADHLAIGDFASRAEGWLALAVIAGLLAGPVSYGFDDVLRRDFGSVQKFVEYRHALRTSELPDHIVSRVWRGLLARGMMFSRIGLFLACVLALSVVLRALRGGSAYDWVAWAWWSLVASFMYAIGWRTRTRIRLLVAEIDKRDTSVT